MGKIRNRAAVPDVRPPSRVHAALLRTGFLSRKAAGMRAAAVVSTEAVTALIPPFTDSLISEQTPVLSEKIIIAVFTTVPLKISMPRNELRLNDLPVSKRADMLPDTENGIVIIMNNGIVYDSNCAPRKR